MSNIKRLAFVFLIVLSGSALADAAGEYFDHYTKALKGDVNSQYVVGRLLIEAPPPITRDIPKGLSFLEKSARAGSSEARNFLINSFSSGKNVGKNIPLALSYLLPLAEHDRGSAIRYLELSLGSSSASSSGNASTCKLVDRWFQAEGLFSDQKTECVIAGKLDSSTADDARLLMKRSASGNIKAFNRFVEMSIASLRGPKVARDLRDVIDIDKLSPKERERITGSVVSALTDSCRKFLDDTAIEAADRVATCELAATFGDSAIRNFVAFRRMDGVEPFDRDRLRGLAVLLRSAGTDLALRAELRDRLLGERAWAELAQVMALYKDDRGAQESRLAYEGLRGWFSSEATELRQLDEPSRLRLCKKLVGLSPNVEARFYSEFAKHLSRSQLEECIPNNSLSLVQLEEFRQEREKGKADYVAPLNLPLSKQDTQIQHKSSTPNSMNKAFVPSGSSESSQKDVLRRASELLLDGKCMEVGALLEINPTYMDKLIPMVMASECRKTNAGIGAQVAAWQLTKGEYTQALEYYWKECQANTLTACQALVGSFIEGKVQVQATYWLGAAKALLLNPSRLTTDQKIALIDLAFISKEFKLEERKRDEWLAQINYGEKNARGALRYVFFQMPTGLAKAFERDKVADLCERFKAIPKADGNSVDVTMRQQLAGACS